MVSPGHGQYLLSPHRRDQIPPMWVYFYVVDYFRFFGQFFAKRIKSQVIATSFFSFSSLPHSPQMSTPDIPHAVLVSIIVLIVVHAFRRRQSSLPLPPGPPRLPIIGNLHNKPARFEWEAYADWGRQYSKLFIFTYSDAPTDSLISQDSEIVYLNMAGTDLVVLNTRRTATDLLEKRGAIYSSRAHSPMVHDLMGFTWLFAVMPNNDGWRIRRRLLQRYFKFPVEDSHSISNVKLTWQRPHETKYVNQLLGKLVDTPDRFMDHIVQ